MVVEKSHLGTAEMTKVEQIAQDPMKHVITVIEKKVRNLDKRKVKLDGYRKVVDSGGSLDPDQEAAVNKYQEVIGSLEFAKELLKAFSGLSADISKAEQKNQRREQMIREEDDRKFCQFVVKVTNVLKLLSIEKRIQEDFLIGRHNAVVLTQNEIDQLTEFHTNTLQLPSSACNVLKESDAVGCHLHLLYEASNEVVGQSSYNSLQSIIDRVFKCGYFEDLPNFQLPTDEDKNDGESVGSSSSLDENNYADNSSADVDQEDDAHDEDAAQEADNVSETDAVPFDANQHRVTTEFVATPQTPPDQVEPSSPETDQGGLKTLDFQYNAVHAPDVEQHEVQPVVARTIEEVLAGVQGQYNFLQDSMLDLEAPAISSTGSGVLIGMNYSNSVPAPHLHMQGGSYQSEHQGAMQTNQHVVIDNLATAAPPASHSTYVANSAAYPHTDLIDNHAIVSSSADGALTPQDADNLGMGQTTFGNDPSLPIDLSPPASYPDAVEPEAVYGTTNPVLSDPPTTHIPLPNEKSSGYKSYVSPQHCDAPPVPSEPPSKLYDVEKQDNGLNHALAAGDSEVAHADARSSPQSNMKTTIAQNEHMEETSKEMPDNGKAYRPVQANKNKPEQNMNNYRPMTQRQQGPPSGNNYGQQRPNHYRGRHYGNFDSMGHPKNFGGGMYAAGGPPYNPQYNRGQQDGGMFVNGPRRGANGPNKGNRGYPQRGHVRPPTSYNRSRTFRPQSSEQSA